MRHSESGHGGLIHRFILPAALAVCLVMPAGRARSADVDLAGKRVAVLIGEGFHDGETVFPIGYLVNRGAQVTVLGIEPGLLKAYNSSLRMAVNRPVSKVGPDDFDALILPGGKGPAVLRENKAAVSFVERFFKTGKPVAAICHGPQVLVTAGVLKGRTSSGVSGIKGEIEACGARYVDREVNVDGNLITSRLPQDLPAFSKAVAEALAAGRTP
ncbi:MAG: DJ-1/PfpI/YhbO family deglycase/protease [bacterium]|nr:DJ-1/PfpI/YhbO family deglycase/protease [bacterium]